MNEENKKLLENKDPVPYYVFEALQAQLERNTKRAIIAFAISFSIVISVFVGYIAFDRYQDSKSSETTSSETYSQEGEGPNIIGNANEVKSDEPALYEKNN